LHLPAGYAHFRLPELAPEARARTLSELIYGLNASSYFSLAEANGMAE
jgi:hypothetical protein